MRIILSIVFLAISVLAWGGPTLDRLGGRAEPFPSVADGVGALGLDPHLPWQWAQDAVTAIGGLDLGLVTAALALTAYLAGDANDHRM